MEFIETSNVVDSRLISEVKRRFRFILFKQIVWVTHRFIPVVAQAEKWARDEPISFTKMGPFLAAGVE